MKNSFLLAAIPVFFAATAPVHASPAENAPPKVIQIFRETLKPGHGAAHEKTEAGWPAAFAKANSASHYVAMTAASGPAEAWFVSPWDSYAAFEKDRQETDGNSALTAELSRLSQADGEHLSQAVSMFASYRDDLSYRPAVSMPQMRFMQVVTFQVKPGRSEQFVAAQKMVLALHEKLNMDEHWTMYQVNSGAPTGTFLMMLPMKAMTELDAAQAMHGKVYTDAMGQDSQKMGDLLNASLDGSTSQLFAFAPKMSYTPKAWAVADAFWAPKAPVAASAPAKALAKTPAKNEK